MSAKTPAFKLGDRIVVAAPAGEYKSAWNGITGTIEYVSSEGESFRYIVQLDWFVVHADKRGTHFDESQLKLQATEK